MTLSSLSLSSLSSWWWWWSSSSSSSSSSRLQSVPLPIASSLSVVLLAIGSILPTEINAKSSPAPPASGALSPLPSPSPSLSPSFRVARLDPILTRFDRNFYPDDPWMGESIRRRVIDALETRGGHGGDGEEKKKEREKKKETKKQRKEEKEKKKEKTEKTKKNEKKKKRGKKKVKERGGLAERRLWRVESRLLEKAAKGERDNDDDDDDDNDDIVKDDVNDDDDNDDDNDDKDGGGKENDDKTKEADKIGKGKKDEDKADDEDDDEDKKEVDHDKDEKEFQNDEVNDDDGQIEGHEDEDEDEDDDDTDNDETNKHEAKDCTSPLFEWAVSHARAMGPNNYRALTDSAYRIDLMPYVYKAYVDRSEKGEYFSPYPERNNYGTTERIGGGGGGVHDKDDDDDDDNDRGWERKYTSRSTQNGADLTANLSASHENAVEFWNRASLQGAAAEKDKKDGNKHKDKHANGRIETDDVLLMGMHGSDLADKTNLIDVIRVMYTYGYGHDGGYGDGDGTLSDAEMFDMADTVQLLIESLPDGYDNPLLTFGARSAEGRTWRALMDAKTAGGEKKKKKEKDNGDGNDKERDEGTNKWDKAKDLVMSDSLVIGDGLLWYLSDRGLDAAGPLFIHAHEFGHHVMFELHGGDGGAGGGDGYTEPDDARRIELLADAFGSYYLSHPNGGGGRLGVGVGAGADYGHKESRAAALAAAVAAATGEVAYALGDCDVDSWNHHGTPDQRRCAANWASKLALGEWGGDESEGSRPLLPPPPPLLHPEDLRQRFDEDLQGIVALVPSVCGFAHDNDAEGEAGDDHDEHDDEDKDKDLSTIDAQGEIQEGGGRDGGGDDDGTRDSSSTPSTEPTGGGMTLATIAPPSSSSSSSSSSSALGGLGETGTPSSSFVENPSVAPPSASDQTWSSAIPSVAPTASRSRRPTNTTMPSSVPLPVAPPSLSPSKLSPSATQSSVPTIKSTEGRTVAIGMVMPPSSSFDAFGPATAANVGAGVRSTSGATMRQRWTRAALAFSVVAACAIRLD